VEAREKKMMQPHIDRGQQSGTFYGTGQGNDVHLNPPDDILSSIFPRSVNDSSAPRMTDLTRQEVDAKLAQNKAEVDARLANFDTSIKTGFAELRAEFAALRTEIADGRTDATKQSHDSMKWIIGTVITMVSLSVAIIGLFINLSKGDKSSASQPAPIIITVPGATAGVASPQAPAAPPAPPAPAKK
jgi:hypothetical protein